MALAVTWAAHLNNDDFEQEESFSPLFVVVGLDNKPIYYSHVYIGELPVASFIGMSSFWTMLWTKWSTYISMILFKLLEKVGNAIFVFGIDCY